METDVAALKECLRLAEQMAALSLSSSTEERGKTEGLFSQNFDDSSKKEKIEESKRFVPPKSLLLYLVRMGSFTSRPQIEAKEYNDDTVYIPMDLEDKFFLNWVREEQEGAPPLLKRTYHPAPTGKDDSAPESEPFRVMQWNILAQALGTHADNFVACPRKALEWERRRFRILEEILSHDPDIICLQEVDHFKFLERALNTQGYLGFFVPKPDSPCIYQPENNGPDGCALFFRSDRFELIDLSSRILEVWNVQSNQVAILATLRDLASGKKVLVLTTHLKARQGALLSSLRHEQGVDLLAFLEEHRQGRPAIICGDFNAEPSEPVYAKMTSDPDTKLTSAYALLNGGDEPPYSTWKIRGDGEKKHNLDYIFYTPDQLVLAGGIDAPSEEEIGPHRVPSLAFPSDHFSLVCDFSLAPQKSPDEDIKGRM